MIIATIAALALTVSPYGVACGQVRYPSRPYTMALCADGSSWNYDRGRTDWARMQRVCWVRWCDDMELGA